jgi:protein AATF/BFR2
MMLLGTRYEVHEKLQNFMVPVPVVGVWHDEQVDELFSSLLGKGFSNSVGHLNDEEREDQQMLELEEQLDGALKGGFRVFG